MNLNQGYIGRSPGDSSVTIARQSYNVTGVTTDFTFASSYTPTLFEVYVNGAKLVNISDYAATDGNTFSLISAAQNGDVVEAVAYKAFNVVNDTASSSPGNFTVNGNLAVTGDTVTVGGVGIVTSLSAGSNISLSGSSGAVTITGLANTSNVKSDTVDAGSLNVTGLSTFRNTVLLDGDTKLNFYSSTSQEGQIYATDEYLYINSSADNGVFVQSNGFIELKKASGSDKYIEMNSHPNHNGEVSLYYNGNKKLETTNAGVTVTGILTATAVTGDGSGLSNLNIPAGFNELDAALFN